jgi:hypothetical protein
MLTKPVPNPERCTSHIPKERKQKKQKGRTAGNAEMTK